MDGTPFETGIQTKTTTSTFSSYYGLHLYLHRVTESQGSLKVHLSTKTGGRATAAVKVYDRADGSYVVNIKVWTFFKDLVIDLTMDAAKDTRRLSIPGR